MSFNSVMEAQLYVALLESAGVEAQLQNDISAQLLPAYGQLLPVNILVAGEDQERAREILGAKFDIDDFHRQTAAPAKRRYSRKPVAEKQVKAAKTEQPVKEKKSAKKAPAGKKTAEPKVVKPKAAKAKATAEPKAAAKKSKPKKDQ